MRQNVYKNPVGLATCWLSTGDHMIPLEISFFLCDWVPITDRYLGVIACVCLPISSLGLHLVWTCADPVHAAIVFEHILNRQY